MSDAQRLTDLLDTPVGEVTTSMRLFNVLTTGQGCKTLRDVVAFTEREILRAPNCGKVTMAELKAILSGYGLALRAEDARNGTPPLPFPSMHERLTRIEQRLDALERLSDQARG